MRVGRSQLLFTGYVVSHTLLYVFFIILVLDCQLFIRAPKSGRVAPVILESAPGLFRLRLEAESRDFPSEEMMSTDAWAQLQSAAAAGTETLKLMESRDRRRRSVETWAFVAATIGLVVFTRLSRQTRTKV